MLDKKQRLLLESNSKQSVELYELREQVNGLVSEMTAIWACLNIPSTEALGTSDFETGYKSEKDISLDSPDFDSSLSPY